MKPFPSRLQIVFCREAAGRLLAGAGQEYGDVDVVWMNDFQTIFNEPDS